MFRRNRQQPAVPEVLLDLGDGHVLTLDDIRAHVLVCGSSGSGKSFSTEGLIARLHQLRAAVVSTGIKQDEWQRYTRIADPKRFIRVAPGSGHRINLFDYLFRLYGNGEGVAEFVRKLNECVLKSSPNSQQEAYWQNLFYECLLNAITLVYLAVGTLNIEWVYRTISTCPKSREEFKMPELLERPGFGSVLCEAIKNRTDANERDLQRAIDFFETFSTVGDKGIGATISQVNGTLGRLIRGPFYEHFSTDTTLTPEMIERDRLCVLLDYPVLKHGPAGRLLNLAWTMLFQAYCLQRPRDESQPPTVLVRDEAQYSISSEFDAQVVTVARSQGLCLIDIVQDLDVLQAALGGDSRAENEAFAFVSNHAVKLLFGNSNTRTGEHFSEMIGEHRQMFATVSSSPAASEGYIDSLLGVGQFSFSASQQMRPHVTASDFASLPQGVCVVHQAGRTFDGKPYLVADLRKKP